jgi:fido (protein-threonine AMPylation protein)
MMNGYRKDRPKDDREEKRYVWSTGIGLQAVDGLKTSEYLNKTAEKHIQGEITMDETQNLIQRYYEAKEARTEAEENTKEADLVAAKIARLLQENSFTLSPVVLYGIHRRLFEGVMKHAGEPRTYDITKKEMVLNGETVLYTPWEEITRTLEYYMEKERRFRYSGLNETQKAMHIADFTSGIWQIHPFREGNTRTTAVFILKYLKSMGYDITNDLFKENSWYFRNALVRANYRNLEKGIDYEPRYLYEFFGNLLLGQDNELSNRNMVITQADRRRGIGR